MTLDQVSIDRINQLHPKIREEVSMKYAEAQAVMPPGVIIRIVQGLRTFPEQHALFIQRPQVTKADAGQSYHNYGLAIDFCFLINGQLSWNVDSNWHTVVNIFKAAGYTWGGDWMQFKDLPHLEKTFGYNWRDLLKKYNSGDFISGTNYVNL